MDKTDESEKNYNNETVDNVPKNKPKFRGKKRKRHDSGTSSDVDDVLPENTLEMEKNLHASAIKNNLDDVSVKKILKKLVTHDHVLALVQLREEEEDNSGSEEKLRPKITRAKAKELMKVSPSVAPWNLELTPINHIPVKTRPEVTALIAQELPEDEDDDEYEPTHDDVLSDDDHTLESCSDVESQPRTPITPQSQKKESPKIITDGPFKVPQEITTPARRKLDMEEEATIALRTRSKLSLSATPIEHIESSFVPPDELPMPAVDDLWNQFLSECLNPVSNAKNEDDDEADPEYNVAADPDANEEDEEALEKSLIKISKKELNDLMTELLNVLPESSDNQPAEDIQVELFPPSGIEVTVDTKNNADVNTVWEGKQEPMSDDETQPANVASRLIFEKDNIARFSMGKTEPEDVPEYETGPKAGQTPFSTVEKSITLPTQTVTTSSRPTLVITPVVPTNGVGFRTVTIAVEEREQAMSEPQPPHGPPPAPLRHLLEAPKLTVNIEINNTFKMYPEQLKILQQQLRQHVQLATSNFLQMFVHPLHWQLAPTYKEYLENFKNVADSDPNSVVNVCNLKSALELVECWEKAVSESTEENTEMVEFIQRQIEKCRQRTSSNNMYIGEFPELLKKVVANSSVFLYPHLLPPMPYRADVTRRRFSYLSSEDALIVLGLDQFSEYVESNPELYKPPHNSHPRRRWALATTIRLVCKHMVPWITPKNLLGHVQNVRKMGDKRNPIVKFFDDRTVEPVKHIILPFNPKLTLYEQPEYEMPRIWIKYLAKSSKRFKEQLFRRSINIATPVGVEVKLGQKIETISKQPLPIDFTKEISSNRINLIPKVPKPVLVDKVDVHIGESNNAPASTYIIAKNMYTIVNTSVGMKLMPLRIETSTVDSANTPICTPAVVKSTITDNICKENNNVDIVKKNGINDVNVTTHTGTPLERNHKKIADTELVEEEGHCKCCVLLRRINKTRQSLITEYFNSNKNKHDVCRCRNKKYPKISNKLRLLLNNYKTISYSVFKGLSAKLNELEFATGESTNFDVKDFAAAISYQMKLVSRTSIIRNVMVKKIVYSALSKFSIESDDPIQLAENLYKIFDVDLADLYLEFLGFLTADQADQIGHFREYFIRNCIEDLVMKIEESISDIPKRNAVLEYLNELFLISESSSCEICCTLLLRTQKYPKLAEYIFSLFPHRRKETVKEKHPEVSKEHSLLHVLDKRKSSTRDYEADYSSSEEYEIDEDGPTIQKPEEEESVKLVTIKHEPSEPTELTITETEVQERSESSDASMRIISEDEFIKTEGPDWNRGEDKLILEVLKDYLTPEERKDKTIMDIIKEKDLLRMIADNLYQKSVEDVRDRVLYLLQLLIQNENNVNM